MGQRGERVIFLLYFKSANVYLHVPLMAMGCGGRVIGVISRLGGEEKEQFPLKNSPNGERSGSLVTPRERHGRLHPAKSQPKPWLKSRIQLTQSIS